MILLVGSAFIAYRQLRFRSPRFPTHLLRHSAAAPGLEQADSEAGRQTIVVRVIGAISDEGTMKLAVYTRPEGFNDPDQALGLDSWQIQGGVCEGSFGLPAEIARLAIAAYHDVNNNGVLDRNALGIPSERYGFSGNARGLTGPPAFSEAVVPVGSDPIQISIR